MGLPRDLVELEHRLREQPGVDLFSPTRQGDLVQSAEYASMLARIKATEPAAVLRLCLQALRIQHEDLRPKLIDAELVATLPPETPGNARPTERVVREMVDAAERELILVGYELTDQSLILSAASAVSRGVEVVMICDRGRGAAARVLATWPSNTRPPRVFVDRDRPDGAPFASMHAKCLLVDGRDFLVTSANFTFHGLHGNIEVGLRVSGAPAAEARKIFTHLVEARIVEELK